MATEIQLRRGAAADWTSADPVLAQGEMGYETDTGKSKVGDGSTSWTGLAYFTTGAGGSSEHLQLGADVPTGGADGSGSVPMPFSHVSGATLLDLSTPEQPAFVDAGVYLLSLFVLTTNTVAAGGWCYALSQGSSGANTDIVVPIPTTVQMSAFGLESTQVIITGAGGDFFFYLIQTCVETLTFSGEAAIVKLA